MTPDLLRERLRRLMDEAGARPIPLAEALGRGRDFLSDFLNGRKDKLPADVLAALAHRLDCDLDYLLDAAAPRGRALAADDPAGRAAGLNDPGHAYLPRPDASAPVIGRVGAGARVEALPEGDPDTVPVPQWLAGAVAFRVVGDSCAPVFEHGDLVLVRGGDGAAGPADFLNRFCIVETDGLGYLKKVRPGVAGRYDLESPNAETLYAREISRPRPVVLRLIQGGR